MRVVSCMRRRCWETDASCLSHCLCWAGLQLRHGTASRSPNLPRSRWATQVPSSRSGLRLRQFRCCHPYWLGPLFGLRQPPVRHWRGLHLRVRRVRQKRLPKPSCFRTSQRDKRAQNRRFDRRRVRRYPTYVKACDTRVSEDSPLIRITESKAAIKEGLTFRKSLIQGIFNRCSDDGSRKIAPRAIQAS